MARPRMLPLALGGGESIWISFGPFRQPEQIFKKPGLHSASHLTAVFRTEAVGFVPHSQFIVKPDWTNSRL